MIKVWAYRWEDDGAMIREKLKAIRFKGEQIGILGE